MKISKPGHTNTSHFNVNLLLCMKLIYPFLCVYSNGCMSIWKLSFYLCTETKSKCLSVVVIGTVSDSNLLLISMRLLSESFGSTVS